MVTSQVAVSATKAIVLKVCSYLQKCKKTRRPGGARSLLAFPLKPFITIQRSFHCILSSFNSLRVLYIHFLLVFKYSSSIASQVHHQPIDMYRPAHLISYCSRPGCKYANDTPPFVGVYPCSNVINGRPCGGTYEVSESMARDSRDWWRERKADLTYAVQVDSQVNSFQQPHHPLSAHPQRPPGPPPNYKTHKNGPGVRPNLRIDTTASNRIKPNVVVVQVQQYELVRRPALRKRTELDVNSAQTRQRRLEKYQKTLRKESGLAALLDM